MVAVWMDMYICTYVCMHTYRGVTVSYTYIHLLGEQSKILVVSACIFRVEYAYTSYSGSPLLVWNMPIKVYHLRDTLVGLIPKVISFPGR